MAKSYLDKEGLLYFLQKIRANATPSMDGTASTGTAKRFALQDHVHPSDTTKAPLASPAFTGTPTAPTATTGTSTTQIATTEFVANTVGAMTSGVSDVKIDNASIVTNGIANIPTASSSAKGLMASTDYSKLDGIASGAEVNQNAFSNVKVGSTTIAADAKTDTLELVAGSNVTLTPDATNDKVTIAATDTTYSDATTSTHGLMSTADKTKLDNISGLTLDIVAGANVTVTPNTTNGTLTIAATDTTYTSQSAASGGTAVSLVTTGEKYTWNNKIDGSTKGAANGVCPLDASSKVDAAYLPSYVDDVIEAYARSGATALAADWLSATSGGSALTPETGKIYVLMADSGDYSANTQFRWGGSAYVKLADGGVSSITNAEIDVIVAS